MEETQNWIDSLLKDIRQVINSPWLADRLAEANADLDITDRDTTGPNFIAAASVLIGVESVGRLATGLEEGTAAAIEFMNTEFPSDYSQTSLLVWRLFRHGHVHNFLPQQVSVADVTIRGSVVWIVPSPSVDALAQRVASSRNEVLDSMTNRHLEFRDSETPGEHWFNFCPQLGLVDLARAVESWRSKLAPDSEAERRFAHGIRVVEQKRKQLAGLQSPIAALLRQRGLLS